MKDLDTISSMFDILNIERTTIEYFAMSSIDISESCSSYSKRDFCSMMIDNSKKLEKTYVLALFVVFLLDFLYG